MRNHWLIGGIATLAELQFELLKVDCAESSKKVVIPAVVVLTGILFLAGSFPVILLAIAAIFYETVEMPLAASIAIAGAIGVVTATLICWFGAWRLRTAFSNFDRTTTEPKRNVEWLKQLKSGKDATNRTASSDASRHSLN